MLKLSSNRFGRIALHSIAIVKGGKVQWHMAGIMREVTPKGETVVLCAFLSPVAIGFIACLLNH